MQTITDEDLAKLKAKHPRGVKVLLSVSEGADEGAEGDEWVFRLPGRADYQAHKAEVKKGLMGSANVGAELTVFARTLLVWPAADAFEALIERAPVMGEEFGAMLLETCAGGLEAREGKR